MLVAGIVGTGAVMVGRLGINARQDKQARSLVPAVDGPRELAGMAGIGREEEP